MPHHHLRPAQAHSGTAETRASIDDLIRPGLSRAFPLPDPSSADERFSRLLEALAQVKKGTSQVTPPGRVSAA